MTTSDSVEAGKQRFHGLDALRAWAMSMGIVLHAAWIMTPGETGAPATDASASALCAFIATSTHMFRMQLFFLLAGFFACLLVGRRGARRFAWNRILRIAIPFLLFWAFLRPLMMWQWNTAKIRSGDNQLSESGLQAMLQMYDQFSAETFLTMHLWFIWYLLIIYAIVLSARQLTLQIDRNGHARNWVAAQFNRLSTSLWLPAVLALIAASLMFPMQDVGGIEIDPWSLYPNWLGLLSYLVYFLVGWLIFRNVGQLPQMLSRWRGQLIVGGLMTIPFYFAFEYAQREGYATPKYPLLTVSDVQYDNGSDQRNYQRLRQQLLERRETSYAKATWKRLPEPYQAFVRQNQSATENQLNGILTSINTHVISDADFGDDVDLQGIELSDTVAIMAAQPKTDRSLADSQRLNRAILELTLPGVFYSEDVNRPYFSVIRAGYSFYYSLTTWLLVFGCLGFAQHFFVRQSRFWRYFSDASYWMYLMHLLVQFQILLWVGHQPWHWAMKFVLYVFGTLLVLVPTYHVLVRPTWLGWLLSGRRYPIRHVMHTTVTSTSEPLNLNTPPDSESSHRSSTFTHANDEVTEPVA